MGITITSSDDKREIKQLWCIASYYFELAEEIIKGLQNKNSLQQKVQDVANICSVQCKDKNLKTCSNKEIMILNAHLASCAIRLNSIDEVLGKKYTSTRWYFYNGLLEKKAKLQPDDITTSADKIVHCLFRHAVAHYELDLPKDHPYQKMYTAFKEFTIEKLYTNLAKVMADIKNDIFSVL